MGNVMKPALLFVTPATPAPTGNGLAMRAYAFLRALSARHRVYLLVANHPPSDAQTRSLIQSHCEEIAYRPVGLWQGRRLTRRAVCLVPPLARRIFPEPHEWATLASAQLQNPFTVREFDLVHVFRLYGVALLDVLRHSTSWRETQLDVDDVESRTRSRMATLHQNAGHIASAAQFRLESRQYAEIERNRLHDFGRVFFCSEADCRWTRQLALHAGPEVIPNVVDLPDALLPEPDDAEFRFLFIGSFGYFPNTDAVEYFCRHVLPVIRARADRPVHLDIAGAGMKKSIVQRLARCPGVRLLGFVEHVVDAYRSSHTVIVPVRAGGGTRIKVLEAFAYGRCVVATPQAVEGIGLEDGKHALLGEGVEGLVSACIRIIRDASLRRRIVANAQDLVRSRYSPPALAARLAGRDPNKQGLVNDE